MNILIFNFCLFIIYLIFYELYVHNVLYRVNNTGKKSFNLGGILAILISPFKCIHLWLPRYWILCYPIVFLISNIIYFLIINYDEYSNKKQKILH